jgi:hypothetical protein
MNPSYLTKLIIGGEREYYESLKRAVIEKLKDIREYDLEMIHEESRDFICQEIDQENQKQIEEYIEYTQKIDVKVILEVLDFLKKHS